jgi:1,4-dihydroxy-2-naphthoyl-CoA hydrolase
MIWKEAPSVETLNRLSATGMIGHLGIEITEIGGDYITATMPVDIRTMQPMGMLHGGASATLAETLGSIASYLVIDRERYAAVGITIEVHHVRPVMNGSVTGTVRPVHIGKKTHLWEIRIHDDRGELACISMLKTMILPLGRTDSAG